MTTKPTSRLFRASLAGCLLLAAAARLTADVIETRNGARIVGKVAKIDAGSVYVATDFAGDLVIKQSEVTTITTDAPVAVRLASGTRLEGRVGPGADGALVVTGTDATISTSVAKVAASWPAGAVDPAVAALARHWTYEATVDVQGKTGNREQLGTEAAFRAVLKTPQDTLQFYSDYNRQVSDGAKSADQLKVGVDYQNNFDQKLSWYARDEGGFDRIMDISFYDVAAAGLGYDLIHEAKHILTTRFGVSFRYDDYRNPATTDVDSAGLDFGINHEWTFGSSRLVNRLSYDPAFNNFSNFLVSHESFYEIPLANPEWKLRLGFSNEYNSKPGKGVEKLDTTYFTRLVLDWK